MKKVITIFTLFFLPLTTEAQSIYEDFPKEINPEAKYIFYSHGYIVEGDNAKPEHPRWGVYDFPKVKESLVSQNHNLIAYHRPKDSDPTKFAKKLSKDASLLIDAGVKSENITFIGFSRGGFISILVSNLLKDDGVNYIILAGCGDYINKQSSVQLYGEVLSILESSDDLVGSCKKVAQRSELINSFEEISISTGKEHGAFYRPLPEWIQPLKKWMQR